MAGDKNLSNTLEGADWKASAKGFSTEDLGRGYEDAMPRDDPREMFPDDAHGGVYPNPEIPMQDPGFVSRPRYKSDVERN